MLFYDVSLEKRVMFQFCGMSHTPTDIFLKYLRKLIPYIMWVSYVTLCLSLKIVCLIL